MVVDSILPHAKSGPNDHRNDAPPFILWVKMWVNLASLKKGDSLLDLSGKSLISLLICLRLFSDNYN